MAAKSPELVIELKLHRKLQFLMEMCPYKVAYGGRNGLKSWAFARALLTLGLVQDLRILCVREVQESIAKSVHQLLKDQIIALGYSDLYDVTDEAIRCRIRDTQFGFTGLSNMTSDSIKSFEGTDVCWAEEAHKITKRSWQILLPTIFRVPNAEVWISFNPDMDDDDTWERFVVHPPEGAKVVEMNWRDAAECGWFPPEQEKLRQYDMIHSKADYDNIWEGKPRSVVAGAIYTSEITDMVREKRFRPMPRDPRLPVHCVWDLGWNDLMTIVMVQKPTPSSLVIVNYMEDRRITYAEMIQARRELRYVWGDDWLPHDAVQGHPTSGTNAKAQLKSLGCKVKMIPKTGPENRIRAARMMFPRIYIDDTKFDTPTDRPDRVLGGGFLVDRLKRYKRHVPKVKELAGEDTGPVHDINSHGADGFGALAEIADQIRNPADEKIETLPGWRNPDPSMGLLG